MSGGLSREPVDETRARLIRERLGGAVYDTLFTAVRRRLERDGAEARSVSLANLNDAERRAIADLYGWNVVPHGAVRVDLVRLDAALRRTAIGTGLIAVVEARDGNLRNLRSEEAAERDARRDRWESFSRHPALVARPILTGWIEDLRSTGLVTRAARTLGIDDQAVLSLALRFIERLPADRLPQSVLAADVAGDAHALDAGQPMSGILLRAAARLAQWPTVPSDASGRRRLWAEIGVLCDPLSANVLTLGLRPIGDGRLAREIRGASSAGEPRRLTLRELTRNPLEFAAGLNVFVCENLAVVAVAAETLGAGMGSLLCTEGMPSTAVMVLIERLRAFDATVAVHADFDWAGIQIARVVWKAASAIPWRFRATDYTASLGRRRECVPLRGREVETPWDPPLAQSMSTHSRAVFEEQVIDDLMVDLAQADTT